MQWILWQISCQTRSIIERQSESTKKERSQHLVKKTQPKLTFQKKNKKGISNVHVSHSPQ
jgi:hypothetical protein